MHIDQSLLSCNWVGPLKISRPLPLSSLSSPLFSSPSTPLPFTFSNTLSVQKDSYFREGDYKLKS